MKLEPFILFKRMRRHLPRVLAYNVWLANSDGLGRLTSQTCFNLFAEALLLQTRKCTSLIVMKMLLKSWA